MVHGAVRARHDRVHRPGGAADPRRPGPGPPGEALGAVVARHESLRMRFGATADGKPVLAIDDDVPDRPARCRRRGRGARPPVRAGPAGRAVRPGRRAAAARRALPARRRRPRPAARRAPHRLRRLVDRHSRSASCVALLRRAPIRCRRCPCSTATSRAGSGPGTPTARTPAAWPTGASGSPACRRWSCPPTVPRPAEQTFAGAAQTSPLDRELVAALQRLAREHGATLFMTLLAAYAALLSRYAGQDDFAVGSPQAGRTHPELEPLVGMFVNMLVTRIDAGGDRPSPSCSPGSGTPRSTRYAHQDLPFEQLVSELNVARDVGRSALFQVVFALQNYAAPGRGRGRRAPRGRRSDGGPWRPGSTWSSRCSRATAGCRRVHLQHRPVHRDDRRAHRRPLPHGARRGRRRPATGRSSRPARAGERAGSCTDWNDTAADLPRHRHPARPGPAAGRRRPRTRRR